MYFNSLSSSGYQNELIRINFNSVEPPLQNARIGTRFYHFYFDTWNEKINFTNSTVNISGGNEDLYDVVPNIVYNRRYILSGFDLNSDVRSGTEASFAITPTVFGNPNDYQTLFWNVTGNREFLYFNYIDSTGAASIYPSHPYPIITKISNTSFRVSAGMMPATGFEGLVTPPTFRQIVKNNNYASLTSLPNLLIDTNANLVNHLPYVSKRRVNYNTGLNKNFIRDYSIASIGKDIILNSFKIEVPVLTSKVDPSISEEGGFILTFTTSEVRFQLDTITNLDFSLACLPGSFLTDLGISYPYTNKATINPKTGKLALNFKAPLWIEPNANITVTYETSSFRPNISIESVISDPNPNYWEIIASDVLSAEVYYYNYKFSRGSYFNVTGQNTAGQDAFTVSFLPSSFISDTAYSTIVVDTVMVDNYYQTSYDIEDDTGTKMIKRFVEQTGDESLSAYHFNSDIMYKNNEWMPADGPILFFNNDVGNRYFVKIQLSAFTGAIYEEETELDFLLNKNDIVFSPLITEYGDNSATLTTVIYPTQSDDFGFKWAAYPPENVLFYSLDNDSISANVFYNNLTDVKVLYLGVDSTEIVVYSEEYQTSASTFWFPPSTVVNDMFLEIKGNIDDYNKTGNGTISAFCNRNGRSYRVPKDANIIWNEIANDTRGKIFLTNSLNNSAIGEGTIYSSSNSYSLINATFSSIPVTNDPKYILFNITCDLSRNDFALNASKLFLYREYPAGDLLTINATSGNNSLFNSKTSRNLIFKNSTNITLSAIYPNLNTSDIRWNILSGNSLSSRTGNTFTIPIVNVSSVYVSVSALSAKPFNGNFNRYNFTDSMRFYLLSNITPLNYIGFPENQYNPNRIAGNSVVDYGQCGSGYENLIFNLYTQSNGMTSYKPCHTENFYFSASPGFSKYVWAIGNTITESKSNKVIIPLSYSNVSANNTVKVSAFNDIFLESDFVTVYNFASSDNSNVYKQNITFLNFPAPSASIELTNDFVNVEHYSELPRMIATINSGNFDINGYSFNIVLSSNSFIQTKLVENKSKTFNSIIKVGIEDTDFVIDENSFNNCKIYLSGNVSVTINGFDFCPTSFPVSSNILSLSVYSGPNLELYALKNTVSAGEILTFYNGSNKNFFSNPSISFETFIFDNGEGGISYPSTADVLTFDTIYYTQGTKSPSLTGITNTGETFIQTWDKLISVKNSFERYDSSISREFYEKLNLPYSLEDVKVKPNDWQYSSVINKSFQKLKTNLDYLSSSCAINNINFPKVNGGYLGERFGNFKWQTKYAPTNVQNTLFSDLRSVQFFNNQIIAFNGNRLEIYNVSYNPSRTYSVNKIGNGEVFENPTTLYYSDELKRLYILDNGKKLIFVCGFDINNPSDITITHYWGGSGSKEDRTKFNNPVDFCVDNQYNLFVVDSDSLVIKVYNKNLNWIRNISSSKFSNLNKPLSISERNGIFSVSTTSGETILIDQFGIESGSITKKDSTNSVLNVLHEGIIYIISGKTLAKYTINNTFINEITYNDEIVNVIFDSYHCYVIFKNYILKFVDFIEIDKVINSNESLSGFDWNTIYVNENEFVTDYIFNDSFKKIKDNTSLLNGRINKKLFVDLDQYYRVINQTSSAYSPSALTDYPLFLGVNEPVLYDTINRGIHNLYSNIEEFKSNIDATFSIPNNNNDIQWRWSFHYINDVQIPTIEKNPVSWREMTKAKLVGNTQLSSYSAWWTTREGTGGNHSEICWNYQQVQCNSLFPLTWHDTECNNVSGHIFTWEDLEKDCCAFPDFVFADCISVC
jgi:hypothetical protein